ncbi:MAG: porphobilinogen deaminase [Methanocella sp. PtaU1.Bin125]|nr:MAG: porphobilinogen deaminase [Methanocella sp. PtaU1.Bin125]
MAQANRVCSLLSENGVNAEPVVVKTSGDVQSDRPLYALKGYGAFVREIDELLLRGEIDAAVHSLKDVPTERPEGLTLAATLKRESALDLAVTRDGRLLKDLPGGAVIGTSSTRRRALIRRYYPGLRTKDVRGNVDTRLRKMEAGEYDGILLAEAGLIRLGIVLQAERLDPYQFVPAGNQGVIAVVTREDSPALGPLRQLNDHTTWLETRVERIITSALDGGCVVPMGAYASMVGDEIDVICEVLSLDGSQQVRVRETIPVAGCEEHALRIAERLAMSGGKMLAGAARKELLR